MDTLILAMNMREASEYARLAALPPHSWRHAASEKAVTGMRPNTIVELPGYSRRGQRFVINTALRAVQRRWKSEYVTVTDDDIQALRDAAQHSVPEHSTATVGDQLDIWDALDEPRPTFVLVPTKEEPPEHHVERVAAVLPHKKTPPKKATAKKTVATAPATPEADFF